MRLIDADAIPEVSLDPLEEKAFRETIEGMPTIEAEPVRRGRWEDEEITLKLSSPITEEEWDMITDVDFDRTEHVYFHTKHGKEVNFYKRRTGKWVEVTNGRGGHECSLCHSYAPAWQTGEERLTDYCPNCGAKMEVKE